MNKENMKAFVAVKIPVQGMKSLSYQGVPLRIVVYTYRDIDRYLSTGAADTFAFIEYRDILCLRGLFKRCLNVEYINVKRSIRLRSASRFIDSDMKKKRLF